MTTIAEIVSKQVTDVTEKDMVGVDKIADGIFYYCNKLKTIIFPNTVKKIGNNSFYSCISLQNFTLPDGLEEIGDHAFNNCITLTSLKIPSSVMYVGKYAFEKCSNISSVDTNGVSWQCLFYGGLDNTKWYSNKGGLITVANDQILIGTKVTTWTTFPSTIKSLSKNAFYIKNLTSIKIPDTVQWIIGNAFSGSDTVKVDIGAGVSKMMYDTMGNTNIGTWIFRQPADMVLDLPKAGENTGLGYGKDSRSITIYTDNESLKAYDWAADNITATIKPLSEAP